MGFLISANAVSFLAVVVFSGLRLTTGKFESDKLPISEDTSRDLILTPQTYSKMLSTRRKEHTFLVKHLLKANYEKSFKMIGLAYEKFFEIIEKNNRTLSESSYSPQKHGFPTTDHRLQEAVTLIIENSCLFAAIFLQFPEISYRIFKSKPYPTWKDVLTWSSEFVNSFPHIIDETTAKLMELVHQQINMPPHDESNYLSNKSKKKKSTKKLKKGPQLSGGHSRGVNNEL